MIATHNIKVNGRWYHAGEEYELEEVKTPEVAEVLEEIPIPPVAQEEPAKQEEPKEEPKLKTPTRRKKVST